MAPTRPTGRPHDPAPDPVIGQPVRMRLARSVRVKGLRRALPAHADGEPIGWTPVTFEVRPGALRVFR
jgi:diacylglycerol kinase family enzyme